MTIPIKRTQKEHDKSYLKSSLWDELINRGNDPEGLSKPLWGAHSAGLCEEEGRMGAKTRDPGTSSANVCCGFSRRLGPETLKPRQGKSGKGFCYGVLCFWKTIWEWVFRFEPKRIRVRQSMRSRLHTDKSDRVPTQMTPLWETCVLEHWPAKGSKLSGFKASTILWKYTWVLQTWTPPGHLQTVQFTFVKWCGTGGGIKHSMYLRKRIVMCS